MLGVMLQDTLVAMADDKVGLCYGDPAKRAAYRDFIYAFDAPHEDEFASKLISCLMFAKALMAHNEVDGRILWHGVTRDVLRESYANFVGQIDTIHQELARQNGLLFRYDTHTAAELRAAIEPGCLIVHGAGGQLPADEGLRKRHLIEWGGIAHGAVVTASESDLAYPFPKIISADGGQLDEKNNGRSTAIGECRRFLSVRGGDLWFGKRRVNYVFPMHKMPVVQR